MLKLKHLVKNKYKYAELSVEPSIVPDCDYLCLGIDFSKNKISRLVFLILKELDELEFYVKNVIEQDLTDRLMSYLAYEDIDYVKGMIDGTLSWYYTREYDRCVKLHNMFNIAISEARGVI